MLSAYDWFVVTRLIEACYFHFATPLYGFGARLLRDLINFSAPRRMFFALSKVLIKSGLTIRAHISVTFLLKKHTRAVIFIRKQKSLAEESHFSNGLEIALEDAHWHTRCDSR